MIGAVLLALLVPQAAEEPVSADVVVTARPLGSLRNDWRACIEQGCPPAVEIARAIAYAEAQLVAGDYSDSWRTLRTTKRRTLKHADELPIDIAKIAKATSRLANLNGEPRMNRIGAVDAVDALQAGLPDADARVLWAKLDVGDAFVPENRVEAALSHYERVAGEARRKGYPAIAVEGEFRRARLLTALVPGQAAYRASARNALDRIIDSPESAAARYRDPARLVRVNLLPAAKQASALAALLPRLEPRSPYDPLLISAPAIDTRLLVLAQPEPANAQQWLNVAYRIAADGRVRDATPARGSKHLDRQLRDAAVTALKQRRYGPVELAAGDEGPTRYARFTFIFDSESQADGGTSPERSERAKPIQPNEQVRFDASGDTAGESQVRSGATGEAPSRIPRHGVIPRIDVFDLGTKLVEGNPVTS